jgi:hypothetical protein
VWSFGQRIGDGYSYTTRDGLDKVGMEQIGETKALSVRFATRHNIWLLRNLDSRMGPMS